MIRVLQYIGSLKTGGSQSMIINNYKKIDRMSIQFDFVIHPEEETVFSSLVRAMGGRIFTCPRFTLKDSISYIKWWNKFFYNHPEYKIVHSHIRSTAAIVLLLAKKNHRVTIAHSHSTSSGSGINAIIKDILQYGIRFVADYFMGCSYDAGIWLFGKRICSSDRYYSLNNAIIVDEFLYDKEKRISIRKKLGYKDSDFVIGHIGRLTDQKNHTFLLKIFKRLHNFDNRYKLLLVGDGELRISIENMITQYDIGEAVNLIGNRSDVSDLLMGMDLFVFPSKHEGLGMVLIEAQASGCPCIVSTAVPREVDITGEVKYLDLEAGLISWCEQVKLSEKVERKNMKEKLLKSGYDAESTAKWLELFYFKLYNNK